MVEITSSTRTCEIHDEDREKLLNFLFNEKRFGSNDIIYDYLISNNYFSSPQTIQFSLKSIIALMRYQMVFTLRHLLNRVIEKAESTDFQVSSFSYKDFVQQQINQFSDDEHFFELDKRIQWIDIIFMDDVNQFQDFLIENPNLLKEQFSFSVGKNPDSPDSKAYLIEIVAYYGAVSIFKFLYINKESVFSDQINYFAIAGGNAEIIHLCEKLSNNYQRCIIPACRYHRTKIYKWLSHNKADYNENVKIEDVFKACAEFHSISMFRKVMNDSKILFFFKILKHNEASSPNYLELLKTNGFRHCEITTPSIFFIKFFEHEMLGYYLSNFDPKEISNEDMNTLLEAAVKTSSYICLKELINYFQLKSFKQYSTTLFFLSCKLSQSLVIEYLYYCFKREIDFSLIDNTKKTCFNYLAMRNQHNVLKLIADDDLVNINIVDDENNTALIIASKLNNIETVRLLLNCPKIDIKAKDKAYITLDFLYY